MLQIMKEMTKMNIKKLVKGKKVVAIVCNQWGDTGKGKISDCLSAYWADVIARGTGGNNAGHTVIVNGKEKIFHLLPSGITYDSKGKISVLGNGIVIDLKALLKELDELDSENMSYKNLMISKDANVIMPYHIKRDQAKNQSQKKGGIGSTGRGIGPCYTDKIARRGITIEDLYDDDALKKKLLKALEFYPEQKIDVDFLVERLKPYSKRIKPFVKDTVNKMHEFHRKGKKILLEGAHGLLLSVEHGTYPYVTSSDSSLNGTATGVGLSAQDVDLSLGIVKFPFMTRVGAGPFPSELGGRDSEEYCAEESTKIDELNKYGIAYEEKDGEIKYDRKDKKIIEMMNSNDKFIQGVGVRLAAGEYGATTGRPRRIGWTDAIAVKYASGINGKKVVLTKVDCISGAKEFKICYGYGIGKKVYKEFNKDSKFLYKVEQKFKTYKGYGDLKKIKTYNQLPISLKKAINDFEKFTGCEVVAISTGPDKDELIIR